jgi:cation transport protein ChaC
MSEIFTCFGYGSLVNRRTLPADAECLRVRVTGWRRAWRHASLTASGRRCTLTVVPDPDCTIFGTVVAQPVSGAGALQQREAQYGQVGLPPESVVWLDERPAGWPDPFIHVGHAEHARPGDFDHPVLLSYLDTVLSGFLATFGDDGPRHFIETTADWHVPVLNDRSRPIYPRAIRLRPEETELVDDLLAAAGATIFER